MSDDESPDPAAGRGSSPLDRLRGIEAPAGAEPARPAQQPPVERAGDLPPEPAPPPPSVIAVGDRPAAYDPRSSDGAEDKAVPVRSEQKKKQGSFWKELPILLVIAIVLAVLIKTFLVQAFYIPSESMLQTLHVHDRVLVNKLAFKTGSPERGDIVVFNTNGTGFANSTGDYAPCPKSNPLVSGVRSVERFVGFSTCGEDDFIKRVIAIPGDTVQGIAGGSVLVNGKAISEPYVYDDNHAAFCEASNDSPTHDASLCGSDAKPITVPKDDYWVMGDNRGNSDDSRFNGFVPRDKLVGRAFVRILPVSRIGFLHVPDNFKKAGVGAVSVGASPALAAPAMLVPLIGGRLARRRRKRRRLAD